MLFTITILSGCIIFLDQEKTLVQLNTFIDPDNILVPICLLTGAVTCIISIRFVERKVSEYGFIFYVIHFYVGLQM